jgi:hypothetical protein
MPGKFDVPSVTTILDLTFIRFPQFHMPANISYLNSYLDQSSVHSSLTYPQFLLIED